MAAFTIPRAKLLPLVAAAAAALLPWTLPGATATRTIPAEVTRTVFRSAGPMITTECIASERRGVATEN